MMKANLKNEYIKVIQEKLDKARISYEIAKKDTIEAEGRMIMFEQDYVMRLIKKW